MRLPRSVQEIADVIGSERALYLVGQLPRCHQTRKNSKQTSWHVILYVPKTLKPDHALVKLLGWHDAAKLVTAFGGEILQPASCAEIYRRFRDQAIARMLEEGDSTAYLAELFGMSAEMIRRVRREKAQEDLRASNDNNPAESAKRVVGMNLNNAQVRG